MELSTIEDKTNHVDELFEKSLSYFRNISKPLIVSYSGGKDSSVLAIVADYAIEQGIIKNSQVEFLFADTRMEMPNLIGQIHKFAEYLQAKGRNVRIVKSRDTYTYWTRILGEGVFVANHYARWCVRQLKVQPIEKHMRMRGELSDYVAVTGIRLDESAVRREKYEGHKEVLTSCDTASECLVSLEHNEKLHPLLEWRNCNIWDFIQFHEYAQPYPLSELRDIYFDLDNLRYGCWTCCVASPFKKNDAMVYHSTKDERYNLLLKFRRLLWDYTEPKYRPHDWTYSWKLPSSRNTTDEQGVRTWRASRLTLETRKALLQELLDLQSQTGWTLIYPEEIDEVRRLWKEYPDYDREGRNWSYFTEEIAEITGFSWYGE